MGFWADLWSFLTAVGTIGMAVATYAIIRQEKRRAEDTDRQHRDRFRPVCVLMPYDGVDDRERRETLIETIPLASPPPCFGKIAIKCLLRNIGTGPALSLRVKFRFLDMAGYTTSPWELPPLPAGETRYSTGAPIEVPVWIYEGSPFNQSDFAGVANKLWEIWLEYEDLFGQRFCAVHHRRLVREEEGLVPNPAAPGKSMYLPQPWVTFPDVEAEKR